MGYVSLPEGISLGFQSISMKGGRFHEGVSRDEGYSTIDPGEVFGGLFLVPKIIGGQFHSQKIDW